MTHSKLLTIADLIDELDMGKATLKFILRRFSPWLATQIVNDGTWYTEQAVTTLLKIKKFLDAGMLPQQVETCLAQEAEMLNATARVQHFTDSQGTIPLDREAVSMFKDLFQVYIKKQDRIASAQEALARVEEKKANAMEKRAAAEEKKADAMTSIALALQKMHEQRSVAPQAMEIAGRAMESLALEESTRLDQSTLDTGFDENDPLREDPDPFKGQEHEDLDDTGSSNMDDLSLLTHETALTSDDIDDLSALINDDSDPHSNLNDIESLLEEVPSAPETNNLSNDMDNLSTLVDSDLPLSDSPDIRGHNEDGLDDLFSLVDMDTDAPKDPNEDLDDLSKLIAPDGEKAVEDLDDLSVLIKAPQPQEPVDDLSKLIESENDEPTSDVDDLWPLVCDADRSHKEVQSPAEQSADAPGMDNLSALIDDTPSIKPDISPDQDMKAYKAAIMKIIIELKEQGLTAKQTTDQLNRDDVATLSGKPAWGLKAVEKIYGFIDSAK